MSAAVRWARPVSLGVDDAYAKVYIQNHPARELCLQKDLQNTRKYGLSLAIAEYLVSDPLLAVVYDRFENAEHRYHVIGMVGGTFLLLVHSDPDPDNEGWIRAISLREATRDERRRYEDGGFE